MVNIALSIFSFIFEILGLVYIKKDLFKTNIFYVVSNILTMIYAAINNLYFLSIQMFIYTFINIETLSKLSEKFKKLYLNYVMYSILLIFSLILFFNNNDNIYIKLNYVELFGVIIGLIGSFTVNILRRKILGLIFYILSELSFMYLFIFIQINYIYFLMYLIFMIINIHSIYYLIKIKKK